ncbi:hypothetical protein ACEPAI_6701 [Sanghuangporus weigelae]
MKCFTETSFRFFIAWFCITLSNLPFALCVNTLNTPIGEVVVYATDPRIQYDPPLDSTSGVWSPRHVHHFDHNASQTSDPSAKVSLVFQGTSVWLYAAGTPGFPPLSFILDNSSTMVQANQGDRILKISPGASDLDPSANHTIVVQKKLDSSSSSLWNIIAFGFTVPPSSRIASPSPSPAIPDMSMSTAAGTNANTTKHEDGSRKLAGGTIAGIVVAILSGIGFAVVLRFCLRRQHNKMSDVVPEPLVILPEPPRRDLSRFHRLYSDRLPHFTAPTSIWPSSVMHASTIDQPALPHAHGSLREKTTPFSVPAPSPLIVKPSPPKRRQPRFSGFFVANPSSHSSRSVRSQSLKDSRVRSAAKATNLDLLASDDPKLETGLLNEKESNPTRVDKGKQRAVDFEIDPALPERPRVARKQSLRRFFFTTNPNPSTTSSSSTSSLGRSATARTAAVADYVRDQIRRHRKAQQGTSQPPVSTSAAAQPSITIPKMSPRIASVEPEPNPVLQVQKKTRTSQTIFFTMNPSPSIPDSNNGCAEAESMFSEVPPPRNDKGKGRAF